MLRRFQVTPLLWRPCRVRLFSTLKVMSREFSLCLHGLRRLDWRTGRTTAANARAAGLSGDLARQRDTRSAAGCRCQDVSHDHVNPLSGARVAGRRHYGSEGDADRPKPSRGTSLTSSPPPMAKACLPARRLRRRRGRARIVQAIGDTIRSGRLLQPPSAAASARMPKRAPVRAPRHCPRCRLRSPEHPAAV